MSWSLSSPNHNNTAGANTEGAALLDPERLRPYLERAVPRYTSYPTAPHFEPDFAQATYRTWLQDLAPEQPVSLYLHVPFCRQLCWYCGCNMKLASRYAPVAAYVERLLAELELLTAALPARMSISHLHWGGGTPTALEPDDLERVMAAVRDRFDFTQDAEIALECDPRTITHTMIERIGTLGFNRASFGVQEFDPTVQAAINRVQPPQMVADCVTGLRETGVKGINFDLIYGLPHQTEASLSQTVALCAEMAPDRVALFGYAHVPWMAKKQRLIDEAALPGPAERLAQAQGAARAFVDAGYVPIGIDHFARPDDPLAIAQENGTMRRNFQGYTTDVAETLLGLGSTSIGRTPSGYVQNASETGAWARAIMEGRLPIGRGLAFKGQDRMRGAVIEALMCYGSADLDAIGAAHGEPSGWWAHEASALAPLITDNIAALDGGHLRVQDTGLPMHRIVAACFDEYLNASRARHSVAV
ncbi:MAG: oxygen-independent coproporphyrinogen III oxidase [Neomegalonema sp.]|nr:oxygen-independent coproporphyrinogen III oxidase [Neomegalonema sp.]